MLRTALVVLVIGGMAAQGQTQKDTPAGADKTEKVDKAAAYYHFMLAEMYAEMAAASGGRYAEYADKARENLKAARKSDPRAPMLSVPAVRLPVPIYLPRLPASRP
jgi:hypothetical protein